MRDEATETLRRLVSQRTQVVQQMTRVKNRVHSILHANLVPPRPTLGFQTINTVRVNLGGVKMIHMMRKEQAKNTSSRQFSPAEPFDLPEA